MSLRAIAHGVRVFWRQFRCGHEDGMVRASITVVGGKCVPIRVCERCGYTDLNPLWW